MIFSVRNAQMFPVKTHCAGENATAKCSYVLSSGRRRIDVSHRLQRLTFLSRRDTLKLRDCSILRCGDVASSWKSSVFPESSLEEGKFRPREKAKRDLVVSAAEFGEKERALRHDSAPEKM